MYSSNLYIVPSDLLFSLDFKSLLSLLSCMWYWIQRICGVFVCQFYLPLNKIKDLLAFLIYFLFKK